MVWAAKNISKQGGVGGSNKSSCVHVSRAIAKGNIYINNKNTGVVEWEYL